MKFQAFCILLASLFITACATPRPEGKTQAEVLYKEAQNLMEDGRYLLATEKLNQLKNQFPYSFYATPAELLQADILFKQESYVEAAAAYLVFRDFHPKHEQMPYIIFRIAEAYYMQIPSTFDRDLQPAFEAIKYYEELRQRFSSSEYAEQAKAKIEKAEKMIRDKERYIADFYYKTEVYEAARWRYLHILENFDEDQLAKHSMERAILSSYKLKDYESCADYAFKFAPSLKRPSRSLQNAIASCKQRTKAKGEE